jgi:DNA-binding NtrC family response regulator
MDDDESVRNVARAILVYAQYDVDCAQDGSEAIDLYRKSLSQENGYSAVVLDLKVKNGIGGKETMKRLLEIDPNVNAIVSSGYSDDALMSHFSDFKFKALIKKPYRADELESLVNRISENQSSRD